MTSPLLRPPPAPSRAQGPGPGASAPEGGREGGFQGVRGGGREKTGSQAAWETGKALRTDEPRGALRSPESKQAQGTGK